MPNLYLRKGGKNYYSPLVDVTSSRASDLIIRHGGQNYAVAEIPGTQVGNLDLYDLSGNTWTVYGSPTVATTNAKFDKAIQFNGSSGIYIDGIELGGADFTVDYWFYHNTSSGGYDNICCIAKKDDLSDNGTIIACNRNGGNADTKCSIHVPGTSFDQLTGISMNALHHLAFVYQHSTSTGRIFVDGVLSKTYTSFSLSKYTCRVSVGTWVNVGSYNAVGSVEEFRISNCARWTENFTPPTKQYTLDGNTLVLLETR